MKPLLRRIAITGGLAAIVLGIVGMTLAELASMWIVASRPGRPQPAESTPDISAMRFRLPLMMAGAGFAIVALGELGMQFLRRNRKPITDQSSHQLDPGERLLEELLAQAEAKANKSGQANASIPQVPPLGG
jgi:hypothetical protein